MYNIKSEKLVLQLLGHTQETVDKIKYMMARIYVLRFLSWF